MNDQLMQYHQRSETLSSFNGKYVKTQGILLFVKLNRQQKQIACFASVRIYLNGKWKELEHLNIEIRKKKQLLQLEPFKTYQFKGEVYPYRQATRIQYGDREMLASVQSYSLKNIVALQKIDNYQFKDLTRFQEHEARKLHLAFEKLKQLPHGQREQQILTTQQRRHQRGTSQKK